MSFLATLGATTFFTLTVLGDEGVGNRVTAYVFVFLVALGIGYNIFIMSRFKQELRTLPPAEPSVPPSLAPAESSPRRASSSLPHSRS